MNAAQIIAAVIGILGAAGSIAAVLVGLGRVLASLDSLREESRKRGDEHAARIEALRGEVVDAAREVAVGGTRADASERRLDVLEREVEKLRTSTHEHGRQIQGLISQRAP